MYSSVLVTSDGHINDKLTERPCLITLLPLERESLVEPGEVGRIVARALTLIVPRVDS